MVRNYAESPLAPAMRERILDNALRAPSAGFSRGWAFLALEEPADRLRFWDAASPDPDSRARGRDKRLGAPCGSRRTPAGGTMNTPLESRLRKLSIPAPAGFASRVRADARAAPGRDAPLPTPSPRRVSRRQLVGLGAAVAALVAAVVVAQSVWGPWTQLGQPDDARGILVAASKKAAEADGTGRYWRTTTTGGSIEEVGDPSNRYRIVTRYGNDIWSATTGSDQSVITMEDHGAEPWTQQDREAWQRAGSPSHWQSAKGGPIEAAGRPPTTSVLSRGEQFEVTVGVQVTLAQLQQLPTDPGALRRQLDAWYELARTHYVPPPDRENWTFQAISELLRQPVSGKVRGALLDVLSTMPRITSLGAVKDDIGRPGKGIAYTANPDPSLKVVVQSQLIIDPATGAVLGGRDLMEKPGDPTFKYKSWAKPGDEIFFWVITTNGYTDAPAPPPTGKG